MKVFPLQAPQIESSQHKLQPRIEAINRTNISTSLSDYNSTKQSICQICKEQRMKEDMAVFGDCGHVFCLACIQGYVGVRMGEGRAIVCCYQGCQQELYLSRKKTKSKSKTLKLYTNRITPQSRAQLKSYIRNHQKLKKRCTSCTYTPQGQLLKKCQACTQPIPIPIPQNFRRCPTCTKIIEKEKGCDHVKCVCGQEFCFTCLQKWNRNHICQFKIPSRTGLCYAVCFVCKLPLYCVLGLCLLVLMCVLGVLVCLLSACFYGLFVYFQLMDKLGKAQQIPGMGKFMLFVLCTLLLPVFVALGFVPGFVLPLVNLCYKRVLFLNPGMLGELGESLVGCMAVLQLL